MNDPRSQALIDDRPCPMGFLVAATFASALLWLCAVLGHLPLR
jgi:hypothetical protein